MENLENRKRDHIKLAFKAQTSLSEMDRRFHYEPMLNAHPKGGLQPVTILGKELQIPMWVSSMTGGTKLAGIINRNLAMCCNEFGMGMGLGSCRIILEDNTYFKDFDMRDIIGDHLPLWANLGIAQIEELVAKKQVLKATELVQKLRADGLIIHVNPIQEWLQPEGDYISSPPLETIKRLLDQISCPIIVKEVGQGIGPESLNELMKLPIQAIEFAAFGGTNFAKVEMQRDGSVNQSVFEPLALIGEDVYSMLDYVNDLVAAENTVCQELIISGGVKNFLDGYYLLKKSTLTAVYGMASTFLKYAQEDYAKLHDFVQTQVKGLELAQAYLSIRE